MLSTGDDLAFRNNVSYGCSYVFPPFAQQAFQNAVISPPFPSNQILRRIAAAPINYSKICHVELGVKNLSQKNRPPSCD